MAAPTPKTEKGKMLAGELYDSLDPQLVAERAAARKALRLINHSLDYEDAEGRTSVLRGLFKRIDEAAPPFVEPPLYLDYGYNVSVGAGFYCNFGCTILDVAEVVIGDRVLFGPNVHLYTVNHPTSPEERAATDGCPEYARPIKIGNDCWIGGNVTILPGVTIGDGCTIGAGSIVTKDIPPRTVAVGAPAKVVKTV